MPALPVKKTFLPVSTALRTAACSLFNFREGRARMGFLFGLAFTWSNAHIKGFNTGLGLQTHSEDFQELTGLKLVSLRDLLTC